MRTNETTLLGYEVGPAADVRIPLGHLCVAGMTQSSGKTTTLEALIARSGRRAVAFVTKRGEGGFSAGHRIPPYFRERADWVFVTSLIDATMGEKNKMLRSFLMKVCRGTKTLAEVQANVKERLGRFKSESFAEGIFTEIDGYLDLVVPQLKTLRPAPSVEIGPGLNVMDLTDYSTELQGLVIRSVLEWVYEKEKNVITVIPEAWEFIPQSRGSPVTLSAEELIRKGGTLGNYLWLDSQDISNINARIRKSIHVWLLGVQREENEVKRTIGYVKGSGVSAPSPSDISTLGRGQFYACFGRTAVKTYVLPAWLGEQFGRAVAAGELSIEDALRKVELPHPPFQSIPPGGPPIPTPIIQEEPVSDSETNKKLDALIDLMRQQLAGPKIVSGPPPADPPGIRRGTIPAAATAAIPEGTPATVRLVAFDSADEEARYLAFRDRLLAEAPALLKVLADGPELRVEVTRKTVTAEGSSVLGRVAQLVARGWYAETKSFTATRNELKRTGPDVNNNTLSSAFKQLVAGGFLTKEAADGYRAAPGAKAHIVEK